jgi:hypothetical protein
MRMVKLLCVLMEDAIRQKSMIFQISVIDTFLQAIRIEKQSIHSPLCQKLSL